MERLYECKFYSVMAHERSCLFCTHCTDVFWDYSSGPYMFICDADGDTQDGMSGDCDGFVEEEIS